MFPGSSERPSSSRSERDRLRASHVSPRRHKVYSEESYASDTDTDASPKHRSRRLREKDLTREQVREIERGREREREREREIKREIEEDRDRKARKERAYLHRPIYDRRTSSAADIERRPRDHGWDHRDRPRDLGRDPGRSVTSDERDRRRYRERDRGVSPVIGVSGRKYPETTTFRYH